MSKSETEKCAEHLRDAKENIELVEDEQVRNSLYSLVWAVEALLRLNALHSVPKA